MKKSGLADSPFFARSPVEVEIATSSRPTIPQPIYPHPSEPMNGRTDEQMNARTDERLNESTSEQANVRTDERLNRRTSERPSRSVSRQSYNIFDDQAEAIDGLALRWRKERGRHITKGEVMRELLDQALKTHR